MSDPTFEAHLRSQLKENLPHRASALESAYGQALNYLENNIYEEIRAAEPNLTDHGSRHIANVQRNILALLGDGESALVDISTVEFYCLAMATLFHDVGNILERKNHQLNIGAIFDAARGTDPTTKREKTLVLRACAAHTGTASDGTGDTLRELAEVEQFEGRRVRLRQLAAILRFADELAEGPQRTSAYRLQKDDYVCDARVYQEYASITHVLIDRGNRRIVLAYEIPVDGVDDAAQREESLTLLLSHILQRIIKLDQERRYAVHYAPILSPFKATIASFNFHCGDGLLDFDLPHIQLDDLTIPGADAKSIEDDDPTYSPAVLAPKLIALCKKAKDPK